MKNGDHLFLVDGSGFIFRAFHALPALTRKSDKLPVGAVSGFCNMLWKLLVDARNTEVGVTPTHFAVIFDYSSTTFRKAIYPEYKANRSAPPEDLIPQFGLIREATRAFNLPCIELEGYEADDIIATFARQAEAAGAEATIISSDKDLMQLVTERVHMYDAMKDKQISIPEVIEKWGVPPEKMIDLQALTGDSTDNVPGIPGIGPKTAAQLLETFGDLETLMERAHEIKQDKRRESIIAGRELVKISKQLVTLKTDTPVTEALDDLALEPQNGPKLVAFLKTMEFTTLTRRVAEATGTDAAEIEPADVPVVWDGARGPDLDKTDATPKAEKKATPSSPAAASPKTDAADEVADNATAMSQARAEFFATHPIDHSTYETVRDRSALERWVAMARETGIVAFDTETNSLDPMQAELAGFSLAVADNAASPRGDVTRACYVPVGHKSGHGDLLGGGLAENQIPVREALEILKGLLEDPSVLVIGQNIKYDWLVMKRHGIAISTFDDTMLMSYVLDGGGNTTHGMDALSERWLGHKPVPYKDVTGSGKGAVTFDLVDIDKAKTYAAEDADITLRLWQVLKPRLVAKGLTRVYERLERPLVDVLARMEERGISVDRQILSRLSGELAQSAARIEDEIYQLAGERFNIGSPKQLGDILFGKMGLPGASKTKTGQWSTSAQVLEELADSGLPLPRKIVDWRQLTKLKSTYTDALPGYIHPETRRVHTSYAMASTSTGRLSSSEPNLQNIPVRTAEGRKIRTAFIAEPGNLLVSADYSQIELRVLAHIAEIPQLKQAFADGIDIHAMTASEMFGVPVEGMPSDVRRRAKAINFGIIYGISAFGLANQLSIERSEAGEYIKKYFERFPGIKDYMEASKAKARENGYVETIFGRRIHYPEIKSSNPSVRAFNERASINAPIQGSAADIIRRAMVQIEDALETSGINARMLLQVHDELIFEAPENEAEKAIPIIREVMENAAMPAISMSVPLAVDARAAKNWDEAH
ncbi:DNA polymerase I [Rhizobium sp. KVB221]|uniref:DNA polymerase I n=1 Tax=Rhizobium setariae TaxID=2801340 RepID=A0A936YWW2_9HYPH|nr:DNA polymerase I [Rhizobium setariae]MBL0375120.1 DNA polymerase I [Rhizobium setariae]